MEIENKQRLLVVSNRLPVTISKDESGKWLFNMSSGGLVSALSGLKKEMAFTWIGWPGIDISEDEQEEVKNLLLKEHSCLPVFLDGTVADLHYNGFSNGILWPLFHCLPGEVNFKEHEWQAYKSANTSFAEALQAIIQPGDTVWVHDYHLMLLPEMLRARSRFENLKIGFFLHTPFPSSEIYRILPVRREVLYGLLECDLIGFHTYDYARHFLSSCTRILGLSTMPNGLEFQGRLVHIGTFPIGIEPEKFTQALSTEKVQKRIQELRSKFQGKKIMIGVDRLDYIKGVPQKLFAFETFFRKYPQYREKIVLIQIAVPTRTDVDEYQQLRSCCHELVGQINGQYGTPDSMPIHFLYRSVDFDELTALYAAADFSIITSTRDGMNLVSYEYIACQQENHGVLLLSEFTGAAQSLNGAVLINPWNIEEVADSIHHALQMTEKERIHNQQKLYRYVTKYTAAHWGLTFVQDLRAMHLEQTTFRKLDFKEIEKKFQQSKEVKMLVIDADHLMTRMHKLPQFAQPPKQVIDDLKALNDLNDTLIYILSGRDRAYLTDWFEDSGLGLIAEHGCFYRHPKKLGIEESPHGIPDKDGWRCLVDKSTMTWTEAVKPLFQYYTERTPGSKIEQKELNMTWDYRDTDPEFGEWQATELQLILDKVLIHMPVSVILGQKWLEVRPSVADNAVAVRAILEDLQVSLKGKKVDFLLCLGNAKTDDPLFAMLAENNAGISCTIGKKKRTSAQYYLETKDEVKKVLKDLLQLASP